jgi:hypothetical protein
MDNKIRGKCDIKQILINLADKNVVNFEGLEPLNKYWCSVPHYLSDIRNIYIKADRFPLMMLTATNKERKQI